MSDQDAQPADRDGQQTDPAQPRPGPHPQPGGRPAARSRSRRRPTGDPFGDVLPDTTADEREPESVGHDDEAWYRENRPPHHDRY